MKIVFFSPLLSEPQPLRDRTDVRDFLLDMAFPANPFAGATE
jgi:hypothetical protein